MFRVSRDSLGSAPTAAELLSACCFLRTAELAVFEWNRNLWLDAYMDQAHHGLECLERAWTMLAEFYRPVGEHELV